VVLDADVPDDGPRPTPMSGLSSYGMDTGTGGTRDQQKSSDGMVGLMREYEFDEIYNTKYDRPLTGPILPGEIQATPDSSEERELYGDGMVGITRQYEYDELYNEDMSAIISGAPVQPEKRSARELFTGVFGTEPKAVPDDASHSLRAMLRKRQETPLGDSVVIKTSSGSPDLLVQTVEEFERDYRRTAGLPVAADRDDSQQRAKETSVSAPLQSETSVRQSIQSGDLQVDSLSINVNNGEVVIRGKGEGRIGTDRTNVPVSGMRLPP
jgi:hypothetical protein